MKKVILAFLIGVFTTALILKYGEIDWSVIFTTAILQAILTIFLAAIAGFIALHQVKLNIQTSYKIRRIEEFKINLSEYISQTHMALWSLKIYSKNIETKPEYYDKYFEALNKSATHRNRIFLELDKKKQLEEKVIGIMININSLLDKFIEEKLDPKVELEISEKQTELEKLTTELIKNELSKSKRLIRL